MKNLILSLVLLLGMSASAKHQGDLHQAYANQSGVFALSFSKDMIDALDLDIEVNDKMKYITGDLSSIKLIAFGSEAEEKSLSDLKKELKKLDYDQLNTTNLDINTEGEFLIYTRKSGKHYTEVHFITYEDKAPKAIFSFYGKIQVKNHE